MLSKEQLRLSLLLAAVVGSGLSQSCVVTDRQYDAELAQAVEDRDTKTDSDNAFLDVSETCERYCDDAMLACTGDNAIYGSPRSCLATCALFDEGTAGDALDNTASCRAEEAAVASDEPSFSCPKAGPSGRGRGTGSSCGTPCEAYCTLHARLCDEVDGERVLENSECVRRCEGLPDAESYDIIAQHEDDTVQCRLVHLAAAAPTEVGSQGREDHCKHSRLVPIDGEWCAGPEDEAPACADYCQLIMVSCTGEHAVYASSDECLAACEALPSGTNIDKTENTIGCRRYHAYSSLAKPENHCAHASPAGDGHCGGVGQNAPSGNCESYCRLARAACETDFAEAFGELATCQETCEEWDGAAPDQGYSLEMSDGDNVQCRVRQAVAALAEGSCNGVFEGAPCD